eukprot:TRINITY_DN45429_c0_g1_i1.p1 TRINITY_DN45429_c0_g1~~TRINITY_DN45429_c0_g1_i1.p1  ORF type:complete len:178 (-),score=22.42 TRINITY_DN45429_c0_g1_i1:448-981(-)
MAGQMAKKVWNESGYPGLPASLRKDGDQPASAPAETRTNNTELRSNRKSAASSSLPLAEQYACAVTHGDVETFRSLFGEDAVMEDPVGSGHSRVYEGVDCILDKFHKIWEVRKPIMVCTSAFNCGPSSIAAHFTMSMQSKSGGRVTYPLFQLFELDGKKIASAKTYWDRATLSSQLS